MASFEVRPVEQWAGVRWDGRGLRLRPTTGGLALACAGVGFGLFLCLAGLLGGSAWWLLPGLGTAAANSPFLRCRVVASGGVVLVRNKLRTHRIVVGQIAEVRRVDFEPPSFFPYRWILTIWPMRLEVGEIVPHGGRAPIRCDALVCVPPSAGLDQPSSSDVKTGALARWVEASRAESAAP